MYVRKIVCNIQFPVPAVVTVKNRDRWCKTIPCTIEIAWFVSMFMLCIKFVFLSLYFETLVSHYCCKFISPFTRSRLSDMMLRRLAMHLCISDGILYLFTTFPSRVIIIILQGKYGTNRSVMLKNKRSERNYELC